MCGEMYSNIKKTVYIVFFFWNGGAHLVMLRDDSWLWTQKLNLKVFGGLYGTLRLNPGQMHVKQMASPRTVCVLNSTFLSSFLSLNLYLNSYIDR